MNSNKMKKPTSKTPARRKPPATMAAIHVQTADGADHLVGIGNLRVMLFNDDGSWFAQSLEIDYFAQGDTLEEVQENFEDGLFETIDYHLKTHGNIDGVLQAAPPEAAKELLTAGLTSKLYTSISFHDCRPKIFPFAGADFYASVN